jgi:hypothetical protein
MKPLTEEEAHTAGQSADELIREISAVLDRWEGTNADKSEYYKACVLIGALVPVLWGMCMYYKVPVTQVLDRMVESQRAWEERKDELH